MKKSAVVLLVLLVGASAPADAAECEVEGAAPTAADSTRARAACESARARYAELFGEPAPGAIVILWDRPGFRAGVHRERAAIFWPTSQAMAARAPSPAAAERHVDAQWREVLPHELSHALLAAHLEAGGSKTTGAGYGTLLPDWLDEGIAIWAEPLESRRGRLAQARALPAARLDLRSILTAPHPAAGNAAAFAARDGTAPQADEVLWSFYPQSIAVLAFVHDAGGSAAVRELTRRLLADPADPEPLAGLPGLPGDPEGVVAAWEAWLAAGPRESAGGRR